MNHNWPEVCFPVHCPEQEGLLRGHEHDHNYDSDFLLPDVSYFIKLFNREEAHGLQGGFL